MTSLDCLRVSITVEHVVMGSVINAVLTLNLFHGEVGEIFLLEYVIPAIVKMRLRLLQQKEKLLLVVS